jgi:hypothetical protein
MIEAIRAATEHRPLKMSGKEAEDEIKAFVTGFGVSKDIYTTFQDIDPSIGIS